VHTPPTKPMVPPFREDSLRPEEEITDERSKEVDRLQRELSVLHEQCIQQKKRTQAMIHDRQVTKKSMCSVLVQLAKWEYTDERDRVTSARFRLGSCKQCLPLKPVWDGGYEAEAVNRIRERNKEDRSLIERKRRKIAKQEKARSASASGHAQDGEKNDDDHGDEADDLWDLRDIGSCRFPGSLGREDLFIRDRENRNGDRAVHLKRAQRLELWLLREINNYRLSFVGREEMMVRDRESRLHVERALHLKRVQRLEAAERSNFRNYPLLADERYQLLNMIGRGGFSEVYRAYDLENNRFCAVKIHELEKDMSDQQCQSYIRRAMREYEIHKSLNHPRVVTLQDCFAISTKAFGTVLELCDGETLDEHMKRYGALPEREARGIVIQILSGLKYMNTNGRKIIHYDLKPGNLFFYNGEIKIADFGLSKVVQESSGGDSIDLTSQGAGTYWYLPPECFVDAAQAEQPKISNKVDVWSTGVIFYELLFNRRPFGHGQSQEALLRATMAASQIFAVDIPAMPKASTDAKEFMRRMLTVSREHRPDVLEAFNDSYLRSSRGRAPPGTTTSTSTAIDLTRDLLGRR